MMDFVNSIAIPWYFIQGTCSLKVSRFWLDFKWATIVGKSSKCIPKQNCEESEPSSNQRLRTLAFFLPTPYNLTLHLPWGYPEKILLLNPLFSDAIYHIGFRQDIGYCLSLGPYDKLMSFPSFVSIGTVLEQRNGPPNRTKQGSIGPGFPY